MCISICMCLRNTVTGMELVFFFFQKAITASSSTSYPISVINSHWYKSRTIFHLQSIILCEVVFKFSLFYESQNLWKCYLILYFLLDISNGENHIKID